MQNRLGGTCNWPHMGGARLIEVAATAGGTVYAKSRFSYYAAHMIGILILSKEKRLGE